MIPPYNGLIDEILHCAADERDPAGRPIRTILESDILAIASRHGCTVRRVQQAALEADIWPRRYARNRESLSTADQLVLLSARVTVVGAGGLGGYVLQLLARIGIGTLVTVDPDRFDETNLNRQAMARDETLGRQKTDIVAGELARINPGSDPVAHPVRLTESNADAILHGSRVAVDALDNIADRRILRQSCRRLGIPLVHGALAGFEGQVSTLFPDDPDSALFSEPAGVPGADDPAESRMGIPAIIPAFIGTLQAMEVIKILLERGRPFRNRVLYADLEYGRFDELKWE